MNRNFITNYSPCLNRDMHMLVYGDGGVPVLAFACQDGMCDNWEGFQMPETIGDYIESGRIQLFCVDSVDSESWSDIYGNKEHRAWMQNQYYHYIVDEAIPTICSYNGSGVMPIVTGCSMGATHAAITFFRRPDLCSGLLAMSGSYSAADFWDGWMNGTLYENSPLEFLTNMPEDHHYIELYNQKPMVLCVGQGAWEGSCLETTRYMQGLLPAKGINAWVDLWGYDVSHDWYWWKQQIRYFLPYVLGEITTINAD